ncbi:hypothetical protein Tcan_03710 [Toxocara canis]|uniref:Uncharacterized protein n=1 Tax=Toxocara canis TaxID=6265 RepID=A0A0B2VI84_TOXCA|nr:hypothetical protein Tcan_03710 [Toxocara canis]
MPQDPNSYNRSLCCRMQTIVFVFCVTEITVISVTLTARMKLIITIFFFVCLFVSHEMRICRSTLSSNIFCIEHPLMVCRWTNVSSVEEIEVGDGRGHWMVNEERFCYTHFLVTIIVFLHVVFDCCAMFAIRMQRHRLLLPFLFLTGFDVLALSMFFLTLIIGFVVIGVAYRTSLTIFVAVQLLLKIGQLIFGRRLYWSLIWLDGNRSAPESSLIKDTDQFHF